MNRQRKYWYLKNRLLQVTGVFTLIVLFYVPIAFATSLPQEAEKEKGSATKNELVSINTTIAEVEEQAEESQQDKIRIDVKGLKAERNSLEQQTEKLQEEIDSLKTQLEHHEVEVAKAQADKEAKALAEKEAQAEKEAKAQAKKEVKQQAKASTNTVRVASTTPTPVKATDKTITVKATAYTAYCNGCTGITTNGTNLRANPNSKVIAVDPNVIPLNSKVEVVHNGKSLGVYTAGDTGGAIKGHKIDIFIPSKKDALDWGVQEVTLKVKK